MITAAQFGQGRKLLGLERAELRRSAKSIVAQRRQDQREHNAENEQQPDGNPRLATCGLVLPLPH